MRRICYSHTMKMYRMYGKNIGACGEIVTVIRWNDWKPDRYRSWHQLRSYSEKNTKNEIILLKQDPSTEATSGGKVDLSYFKKYFSIFIFFLNIVYTLLMRLKCPLIRQKCYRSTMNWFIHAKDWWHWYDEKIWQEFVEKRRLWGCLRRSVVCNFCDLRWKCHNLSGERSQSESSQHPIYD